MKAAIIVQADGQGSDLDPSALPLESGEAFDAEGLDGGVLTARSTTRVREVAISLVDPSAADTWIGIGGTIDASRSPERSRREAERAITLGRVVGWTNRVVAYEDVVIVDAIACDRELRLRLIKVLEPIASYDRRKRGALMDSLEQYVDADLSAARTARALGIHRHTFDYRLSKVEQLLGHRMSDFASRLLIESALIARRIEQADL